MESTSKQNYVKFITTKNTNSTSTNNCNKIIKTISTNRQKLLFTNRSNNLNNYDYYRNFSSKKFNNNNINNNKKKFPNRTTSLYELSSSSSSLSLLYKDSIDNYDNDDIVKNIVCLSPTSSLSSSSLSPPPPPPLPLPQLSSLSTIRNGYHRNNDGNYRKFSSCRQHNLFRDTIITQYSPSKDMTSILERRSGSSSIEKDPSAIMTTTQTTPTTTTTPILKNNNSSSNSTILREKIYNNEISTTTNGASNNCEFLSSGSSSTPSWLIYDDIDAVKGKIKMKSSSQQQFSSVKSNNYSHHREYQHHSQQNQKYSELSGRYRYSESEKESPTTITTTLNSKRTFGIRSRSESEPNDLCNMKYWSPINADTTHTDVVDEKMCKRTNDEQQQQRRFVEIQRQQYSTYKLPPKNPQHDNVVNKRTTRSSSSPITSPRLSIYTKSSKSPGIIRKTPSTRSQSSSSNVGLVKSNVHCLKSSHISSRVNSSSGCGSPRRRRSNNSTINTASNRRCRTKSPSPTYTKGGNKYYGSTAISSAVGFRKAKSVTPPPKLTRHHHQSLISPSLPPSNDFVSSLKCSKKSSESSVPRFTHSAKYGSDNDNDEDEDDDDFDNDLNDDNDDNDNDDDDDDVNSSSDSENGYRAHAYVSNFEKSSSTSSFQCQGNNASVIDTTINYLPPSCPLVPSLFPNVPPYLAFSTDSEKGPQLPQQVHKILKWKLTTIMPKVVRRILINSGFRLLKKTNDWMGTWGKHMKSPCFRAIRPYQKINHLPGSFKIGRKDSCWKNLQIQMIKHGKKEFGFMPKTYIIPQDLKLLRKSWPKYAQKNFKWIIKPPASARGTGIKVVNRWSQIPKRKPVIVQKYIERPFLINGSKFDLRLYVLVTSINPLRVYLYHDGLVRFASVKYSEKSDTLSDRCMHLTNYSINKFSSNYAKNEDVYACHGHKWTIKSLWAFFEKRGINTNRLWGAFRNLILRTLLAGENAINAMIKLNVESKYNCFELFGFDILLDSELVPWLLEVNISPSLHSELTLDLHVKAPLVQAVLNTALYHIPPKLSTDQQKDLLNRHGLQGPLCFDKRLYVTYLSRAEKLKHQQFTRKSLEDRDEYLDDILENLTPDDIRCLITTEDELSRCKPLERIFPTQYTHKYLKYTESPRYYNRLLDAWENKYGRNRLDGINLLKNLCEQKLHLDIPPVPMRKPIKIRTRTLMMRRRIMRTSTTTAATAATATMTSYLALTTTIKSIKKRNNRKSSKIKTAELLTKLKNLQQQNTSITTSSTPPSPPPSTSQQPTTTT